MVTFLVEIILMAKWIHLPLKQSDEIIGHDIMNNTIFMRIKKGGEKVEEVK